MILMDSVFSNGKNISLLGDTGKEFYESIRMDMLKEVFKDVEDVFLGRMTSEYLQDLEVYEELEWNGYVNLYSFLHDNWDRDVTDELIIILQKMYKSNYMVTSYF